MTVQDVDQELGGGAGLAASIETIWKRRLERRSEGHPVGCVMALFRDERRPTAPPAAPQAPVSFSLLRALKTGLLFPVSLFVSYLHTLQEVSEPFLPRFYKVYVANQRRRYKDMYRVAFANRAKPPLRVARQAVQYFNRIGKAEAWLLAVTTFVFLIIAVPLFVFLLPSWLLPLVQVIVDPSEYPISKATSTSMFTFAFLGTLTLAIFNRGEERRSMIFCALIFFAFLALGIYVEYDPSIGAVRFANIVTIGIILDFLYIALYMTVLATLGRLARAFKDWYLARAYPDAATFLAIMRIAADCNADERNWNNLNFRAKIIGQLDRAANIIDNNLAKQLASSASGSSKVVKDQWHQIADGIRSKVQWITTPQDNTRQDLVVRLQDFLINFASGNWHALIEHEQFDTTALRKASRVKRFVSGARACLLAVAPMALTYGYQRFVGDVGSYAKSFSLLWFFVCVVPIIDPLWKERLATLKDVVSTMKDAKDLLKSGDAKPSA